MAGFKTKASLTLFIAFFAALYQLYVKELLALIGVYPNRPIEAIGNENCEVVKGLESCEKIVIHQQTGVLYLACSSIEHRRLWTPSADLLNPKGSGSDYIMQYNPSTKQTTRMTFAGLEPNKYSSHGMDVVVSSQNPNELFFYLVNHRTPTRGDPKKVGADSVVQVFRSVSPAVSGKVSERLVWTKTYKSKHIHTPNDVVGSPDGKSFYVTNDRSKAVGITRILEGPLKRAVTSVVYCHESKGCKVAAKGLVSANGITTNGNGTFFVASSSGWVQVLEEQKNNTLVIGDKIITGIILDNLSLDADGMLYAGALPKILPFTKILSGSEVTDVHSPSMAIKFTKDIGKEATLLGHKYRTEIIFQNDGSLMTTATSAAVDSKRKLLYLHGILAPYLLVCKL